MNFDELVDDSHTVSAPAQKKPEEQSSVLQAPQAHVDSPDIKVAKTLPLNDFDSLIDDEEKYGSTLEQAKAGAEGLAKGIAGPFGPLAEVKIGEALGYDPEEIKENMKARERVNPGTHFAGEALGLLAPALATAGGSLLERAGIEGAAEAIPQLAKFTQAGALEATGKALIPAAGETLASKIGTTAAKAAVEGALLSGSDEVSRIVLNDPSASVETIIPALGLGAIIGGVGGAGLRAAGEAISPLVKATHADKLAKTIADFNGELKFQTEHTNHAQALVNELQDLHRTVIEPASEVYGVQGLKAKAIEKALPPLNDQMLGQVSDVTSKLEDAAKKLGKDARANDFLLSLDEFKAKIGTEPTSKSVFDAIQDLKQEFQEIGKSYKGVPPVAERRFASQIGNISKFLMQSLEDSNVWGEVADLQKGINKAFTAYQPNLKAFESTFITKVPNAETGVIEKKINPAKVETFIKQIGSPKAEIKQEFLENFVKASDRYKGEIDKLYQSLGLESPIEHSSRAVINHALGEQTLGAKLARTFTNKLLGEASAHTAAAVTGGFLGHALGVGKELGAIIGERALTPFFKSTLPAIAKSLAKAEINPNAFRAAADYIASVAEGDALISKAAKNVFRAGSEVLSSSYMPKEADRLKIQKAMASMQQNPEGYIQKASSLGHYLPEHSSSVAQLGSNTATYLNNVKSIQGGKKAPLDTEPVMSSTWNARVKNAFDIAQQPLLVLHKIKEGTVTAQDLMDFGAMYPKLYGKVKIKLLDEMTDHISKGHAIPYKTRIGLSMFLGQPLDSTMTPQAIQAAQNIGVMAAQSPMVQNNQSKGSKSSPALQKMPNMYQTSSQARLQRSLKQ